MNSWEILGIDPTDDVQLIKKAYAQKSKLYHPETHPEAFQQLHSAYKGLMQQLKKSAAQPTNASLSNNDWYQGSANSKVTNMQELVRMLEISRANRQPTNFAPLPPVAEKPVPPTTPQSTTAEGETIPPTPKKNITIEGPTETTPPKKTITINGNAPTAQPVTVTQTDGTAPLNSYHENIPSPPSTTVPDYTQFLNQVDTYHTTAKPDMQKDPLILQLQKMLEFGKEIYDPEAWRDFFFRPEFLARQYEPEFIKAFAGILNKQIRDDARLRKRKEGLIPGYLIIYIFITYGCMLSDMNKGYKTEALLFPELLKDFEKAFRFYEGIGSKFQYIERRDHLLGERHAFYIYRNILALLDYDRPDQKQLNRWLRDALERTNTSHVLNLVYFSPQDGKWINNVRRTTNRIINSPYIFELLVYLLESDHPNLTILEDVMEDVLKFYHSLRYCKEEREILMMMIQENRKKRK